MNQKQLEKYMDGLWDKHAHPDHHGYRDWMSPDGFHNAVREALQDFGVDVSASVLRPPSNEEQR